MHYELIGIDTNVLVRALAQDDARQSALAAAFIAGLSPQRRGFVTVVTLVETYWTLRRTVKLSRGKALRAIRFLVEADSIEFEDGEAVFEALMAAEEGADFPDALIAASMRLFGVDRVVTFDRKAASNLGWELL